jgi:hypothetical protein
MISPNTAQAAAEAIRRGHRAGGPGHDDDDACLELARRVQAEGTVPTRLSPLDMAVNLAGRVQDYAEALNDGDPDRRLQAHIAQAGERAHAGGQLAANLALVSIAQDLHRVIRVMIGNLPGWDAETSVGTLNDPDSPISRWARNEGPLTEEGAVDDARATREHMRDWARGETTHPGEQP